MSYDLILYAQTAQLPAPETLMRALMDGVPSVSLRVPDLLARRGYVQAAVDGRDTGFEVTVGPVSPELIEDYQADLADSGENDDGFLVALLRSDVQITLSASTDLEIEAAKLVAGVLTRLSGGYLSDPQDGTDFDASTLVRGAP
jgi:hypothetical protein